MLDHLFKKTNGSDAPKPNSGCSNNNGMPPAAALQFAPLMSAKTALISKPKPRDAAQSCCDHYMLELGIIWVFHTCCPAALPIPPDFHLPRRNLAGSLTKSTKLTLKPAVSH